MQKHHKTVPVHQEHDSQANVQRRPKTVEPSKARKHDSHPLENISCRIGDNACAAKHVSVIQRTGLFYPMNQRQKVQSLFRLQRQYGNRFVQRVIAHHVIQTKLQISQPGDIYEQEADGVAEQVMNMPDSQVPRQPANEEEEELLQPNPLAAQITPLVQRQIEEEEEEELQAKELPGQTPEVTLNLDAQVNGIRSGGQPLPASTRDFFEPRFGCDFSQVRVHTDSQAAETAQALNARAFTTGYNIFRAGQYSPNTLERKRLLAHELTHVVQQDGGKRSGSLNPAYPTSSDSLKQEVDRVADRYSSVTPVSVQPRSDVPAVQTAAPAALAIGAAAIAALGACAYGFYRYTLNNYSGRQGYNDKFMHCYTSCKIASHCASTIPGLGIPGPASVLFSEQAGILKEVIDYIKDTFGIGTPADASWEDWFADNYGIGCSFHIFTPCEECCRNAPGAVAPTR